MKAKTIQKYLTSDYVVRATIGHIADIPRNAPIDVTNGFDARYELSESGQDVISGLRSDMAKCSEIILATDPDREGEIIAFHVVEFLRPTVPFSRITFNAVTKKAIEEALQSPREINMDLVEAAMTRRILDRLFGFELSHVTRSHIRGNVTAGRVQAPGLCLVVERELERLAFVPAEYMDVDVRTATDPSFEARLLSVGGRRIATGKDFNGLGELTTDGLVLTRSAADHIAQSLREGSTQLTVAAVTSKAATSNPRPPLDASALFQEAGTRLGMTTKEIDSLMNVLHQKGHITYPRPDIRIHSAETRAEIRKAIVQEFGADFVSPHERYTSSKRKMAQGAHFAIAPTDMYVKRPAGITPRAQLLYGLIWAHTIATQMKEASGTTTTLTLTAVDPHGLKEVWEFTASNTVYFQLGYRIVRGEKNETMPLHVVSVGDVVPVRSTAAEEHQTKAPPRFTEATLIKALEERGIGRPSTYKTIISKLRERFVWSKQGSGPLIPTVTGFATYRLLKEGFASLVDYDFTKDLEERLDEVANDSATSLSLLSDFYFGTESGAGLQTLVSNATTTINPKDLWALDLGVHPQSGHHIYVRPGRMKNKTYSPYLECNGATASIPDETSFEDLTIVQSVALLARSGREPIGEIDGLPIFVKVTGTGAYFQMGDKNTLPKKARPRTAGLLSSMDPDTVTLADAHLMFSLPRHLGLYADTGEEVWVHLGRYGGYVKAGEDTRSLRDESLIFSITFQEARDLLRTPKKPRRSPRGSRKNTDN